MKNNKHNTLSGVRKLCTYLLVAVLVLSTVCIGASAAATQEAVRMNVMLVIDGSGSLTSRNSGTDPRGLRYDAIDLFLALLTNSGNNVGAIVFNEGSDTFLLDESLSQINGKADKLALSSAIRAAGTRGDTNIGAALLKGVQEAAAMTDSNGLPSVVILFSDGRTDVSGDDAMQASLDAKEDAIVAAQNARIPIYTICLAANAVADPAEMQEIADRTSGSFAKVEDPQDLSKAFEAFYSLIFASAGSEIQQTGYDANGKLTFDVPIPAYGAEEVNIILNSTELDSKTITTPSGVMSDAEVEECTMSGGYYDVIKIVDPEKGKLVVELTGVPQGSVTVNVLYNINSTVELTTADGRQAYAAGETVTFHANLFQNGNAVLNSNVTNEYTAKLTLTNLTTGQPQTVNMVPDGNGTFTYDLVVNECTSYTAKATLSFSNLELESEEMPLDFDNSPPVTSEPLIEEDVVVLYFFNATKTYELSKYFSDPQGDPIVYSQVSSQFVQGTVDVDSQTGKVTVDAAKSRSGELVVKATDDKGASTQMIIRLNVTNLTLGVSLAIIALILIGAAIVIFIVITTARKPWKGRITVTNLSNNHSRSLIDFRGSLNLKKFNLGRTAVDGKFVTTGHGHLEFVSKKPVYACRSGNMSSPANRVSLTAGMITIYADKDQTSGIAIKVDSNNRPGGRGGMGGPNRAPQNFKNAPTTPRAGNPFGNAKR